MNLIASYKNAGFEAVADGAISFFDRRKDMHESGIAFGDDSASNSEPSKVSHTIDLQLHISNEIEVNL